MFWALGIVLAHTYMCNRWPSPPARSVRQWKVRFNLTEEASAPSLFPSSCIIYLQYGMWLEVNFIMAPNDKDTIFEVALQHRKGYWYRDSHKELSSFLFQAQSSLYCDGVLEYLYMQHIFYYKKCHSSKNESIHIWIIICFNNCDLQSKAGFW